MELLVMVHTWTRTNKASGTSWTRINKPSDEVTISAGMPIGLLLALTYANSSTKVTGWTRVQKASGTAWTRINKAT